VDRGDYDSAYFEYDAERDEVICPRGARLKFENRASKGPHRPAVRRYRCHSFQDCPVRALCSRSKKGRRIEWSPQREALRQQQRKRQDPAQRALLRRRKAIVEPVFGILKQVEGFRRWTARGLENVRTQWALVCTAYNLKKLAQAWKQRLAVGTWNFRTRPPAAPLVLKDTPILSGASLGFEL
jgi:hypothetical protein